MKNIEGYWRKKKSDGDSLSWPIENSATVKESEKLLEMLVSVEDKAHRVHYKGWSDCRICGKVNGSIEFEYKNWKWPEGLYHYINAHRVRPSDEFVKFITIEAGEIK